MFVVLFGYSELTRAANSVEDMLKGISPVGGMCLRDEVNNNNPSTASATRPKPDITCAITPSELSPLLERSDLVLADVRLRADYDAARMDGAIHFGLSALRIKPFLRDKLLVLIGNGKSERELYATCAELKEQGFKQVKVLRGGMAAWWPFQRSRGMQSGIQQEATQLTGPELWVESQFDANLVLLMTSDPEMQRMLPTATQLPNDQPVTIRLILDKKRKAKKMPIGVVLVLPYNASPSLIERVRDAVQPLPLLFYSDSSAQYAQQIAQQKAIWLAQERGPKKLGCGL